MRTLGVAAPRVLGLVLVLTLVLALGPVRVFDPACPMPRAAF